MIAIKKPARIENEVTITLIARSCRDPRLAEIPANHAGNECHTQRKNATPVRLGAINSRVVRHHLVFEEFHQLGERRISLDSLAVARIRTGLCNDISSCPSTVFL